jgi:hypothetical protein
MYREDRDLVRKCVRGALVPIAKLKEIIAAAFNRMMDDGSFVLSEMVLRFLGELRPEGSRRRFGQQIAIRREDLSPLRNYVCGGRVSRTDLEEIVADVCDRLLEDGVVDITEMMFRILDGLRPVDAGGLGGPYR